jgi:hypothetical protein
MKKAFPDSADCSPTGSDKYYYKNNSIDFLWCSNNTTELPAQSVHDFLINEKKSEYNSNKEKIKIENFISKLSKNQAIEIIKNILNDMLDKDKNNN